jgi:hypothetical protein
MMVTCWHFHLANISNNMKQLTNTTSIDVMQKRNALKKGLACRLNCRFMHGDKPVLDYSAEHSYVIDFENIIDKHELLKMFRNSFLIFEEKFELRKLGTVLHDEKLRPPDETFIDLDSVLPLLN